MAAQYTEISLEDMERFLKRGFRALRPKQGIMRNEYYYDLNLGDSVAVRVWTSVKRGTAAGAGVGEDAIRVQMISAKTARPLMKGKAPIVKRTQNWKDSLQNRIEDVLEAYDEKEGYWEAAASGVPAPHSAIPEGEENVDTVEEETPPQRPVVTGPPPSDKQVGFASALLRKLGESGWEQYPFFRRFPFRNLPDGDDLRQQLNSRQVSALIEELLRLGFGRRYAAGELAYLMDDVE